jgi:hypothetical protein
MTTALTIIPMQGNEIDLGSKYACNREINNLSNGFLSKWNDFGIYPYPLSLTLSERQSTMGR